MPAYVSHTIMARDVYKRINNKNVSLDYMITFSLGGDLSKYAKCRYDSHHKKEDDFLYNMCDYIIDNNLYNDKEIMGVLYGHVCHLTMDRVIHPLVRKVDKECVLSKNNHTMIELYYDNYLSKEKYNVPLNKHNYKELFNGKMNKKVSTFIDYVYKETYDTSHLSRYYKFNLFLYKKIKYLYKICTFNFLKVVSGMKKFLKNNKKIDLLNNKNKISYINERKEETNDNLDTLYEKSVIMAIDYIEELNKYIEKGVKNGRRE